MSGVREEYLQYALNQPTRATELPGQPASPLPWLEFELPAPPSVNRFMGKLGNRSPLVQKWIKQADMAFILSRCKWTQLKCAYEAEFIFARRANSDLDNRAKPLMDYLQRIGIIENDRMCERLTLYWSGKLLKGRVIVRLRPWLERK